MADRVQPVGQVQAHRYSMGEGEQEAQTVGHIDL
jgi:hypothetical protein